MATRTVHTLAYKLLVDSSEFEKGMVASRSELSMAKREMRSTLSPAEKMEVSLQKLGNLAQKDAKFQGLYNRKLDQYQKHLKDAAKQSGLFHKTFGKSAGFVKAALATVAVGSITSAIETQIDRVDKLAKTSDKLGASTEFLSRLQFTAGQTSGLGSDATLKGIEKMTRRISEAAAGGGEAVKVIDEIGLSARVLAAQGPEKAFMSIARAMDNVTAEHDRLRIATKLFDDEQAGLHTTLKLSNSELQNMFSRADRLGRTINRFDVSKMEQARDAITEMNVAFESFTTQFALTIGPGLTQVLHELRYLMETMPGLRGTAPGEVNRDATAGDAFGAIIRNIGEQRQRLADGNFREFLNPMNFFDTMTEVTSERVRAETEFNKRIKEAEANREKLQAERTAKAEAEAQAERARKLGDSIDAAIVSSFDFFKDKAGEATGFIRDKIDQGTGLLDSIKVDAPRENVTATSGPLESLAAGTSEAFKFENQTTAVRSVEVDMARTRTANSTKTVSLLESMQLALTSQEGDPALGADVL